MALSVAVQKDIGEYEEKIVLGLGAGKLAALGIGAGLALAEAIVAAEVFGKSPRDIFFLLCLTVAGAFFAGFIRPHGMPFKLAAVLFIRQWLGAARLIYRTGGQDVWKTEDEGYEVREYYRKAVAGCPCPEVDIPRIARCRVRGEGKASGGRRGKRGGNRKG